MFAYTMVNNKVLGHVVSTAWYALTPDWRTICVKCSIVVLREYVIISRETHSALVPSA